MKKIPLVLSGLFLLLMVPLAAGAMDADELIAKHLKAVGGVEKLKSVRSMRATGTVQVMGMEMPFTTVQKRPHKMRIDSSMMGSAFVQAFDGENGWMINPMTGSPDPQDMPETAEKLFRLEADMDGLLVDYADKGFTVEYVGEDEVEGTPVYHLKLDTHNDVEFDMYFDTEYFLLIKQVRTFTVDESTVSQENYFGNFEEVDGIVMPFSIEQRQGGQTQTQIMIEKVELGVDVADEQFVKPAAAEKSESSSGG